jgi:hypothetical protein
LVVDDFRAAAVATDWGGKYNGHIQGYFPVTIISDSRQSIPLVPNDLTIALNRMVVTASNPAKAGGRPVIGCQATGENGECPTPCAPETLWPISGTVVIHASNHSACDTAALGRAAAHLDVKCKADSAERLKTDDGGPWGPARGA